MRVHKTPNIRLQIKLKKLIISFFPAENQKLKYKIKKSPGQKLFKKCLKIF